MDKGKMLIFVMGLTLSFIAFGCSQQQSAANSSQAIEKSQTLSSVQEKANYLVQQANSFINSKNFEDAISTAKYILANLDQNSSEAKSILQRAQEELKKLAEQKLGEVKAGANKAMDDAKNKLGNLGK